MMNSPQLQQELRQVQKLSLQQIQYLRLLQMNTLELNDYLSNLQLENPLLELHQPQPFCPAENPSPVDVARWIRGSAHSDTSSEAGDADDSPSFDEIHADLHDRYSLEEYLKSQIDLSVDGEEYRMLDWLIGFLDANGYLTVDAERLAQEFSCDLSLAQEAIGYLQTLDPPGIGAADLVQCLQIQLIRLGVVDDDAMHLCSECLEDLSLGRFQKAAKIIGSTAERVMSLYAVIRTLNPRPASSFGDSANNIVIPDIIVRENEQGLSCTYNRRYSSTLTVNENYLSLGDTDPATRDYLNRKMSQAMWILRAVEQRQQTIERIVNIILQEQLEYFTSPDASLRPLRRKDVAQVLGIHESTVSRAISDKYLQCRRGIFPLKSFFSAAVSGEVSSGNAVQTRIRSLIQEEDPAHPLSDSSLCKILEKEGITIARRTVAKYREGMGILSSAARKK